MCVCNGSSAKILKFNNYGSLKEELQLSGNIAASKEKTQQLSVCYAGAAETSRGSPREALELCNLAAAAEVMRAVHALNESR